ncbi:MAG: transketolase [Prevotella sp.]|nr:transketolase [Prevotella sp.]MBP3843522.1 transketolase [Prevotella sp.]
MSNRKEDIKKIMEFAHDMRPMALEMAKNAGKGGSHIGGSYSSFEIMATLYGGVLRYDVKNPEWDERDRFLPSKNHCYLAQYPALCKAGFIKEEDLITYHQNGSDLVGYPWNVKLGLELCGGALGLGLGVGVGMALTAKRFNKNYKVYVLLGDGECNEGSVWEAFMSAAHFKLDNLIAIVDYNNMQFDGVNDDVMSVAPMADKLKSFGWEVVEANGHNVEELYDAFLSSHQGKPLAIVAHTIKAHGIPSLENKPESHHADLSNEDYELILKDIQEGEL